MTVLFALCKPSNGPVSVKRVETSQPVQNMLGGLFQQQAVDFLKDVDQEIAFGGDYKPDPDEILYLEAPNEIVLMEAGADNPMGLPTVGAANFMNENIRGLFISVGAAGNSRFLIQSFNAQQFLTQGRVALIFDKGSFRQVTEPSFALDNKLVAIAENKRLKFKSFHFLKRIFVLEDMYREASDPQIDTFCAHPSLAVADVAALKAAAGPQLRSLIHAIQTSNVLGQNTVVDIHTKAVALNVALKVENGRIVMPTDKQELKYLLRFLDDSIYQGPISAQRLLANSKRPMV